MFHTVPSSDFSLANAVTLNIQTFSRFYLYGDQIYSYKRANQTSSEGITYQQESIEPRNKNFIIVLQC